MRISEILIPAVLERFPGVARLHDKQGPIIVVDPKCDEVGELRIYDDGSEATISIEHITHHHVNPYNSALTPEERARVVTDDVMEFLDDLFGDRVLLWSFNQGHAGGGWLRPYEGVIPDDVSVDADVFLWSRRLRSPFSRHAG